MDPAPELSALTISLKTRSKESLAYSYLWMFMNLLVAIGLVVNPKKKNTNVLIYIPTSDRPSGLNDSPDLADDGSTPPSGTNITQQLSQISNLVGAENADVITGTELTADQPLPKNTTPQGKIAITAQAVPSAGSRQSNTRQRRSAPTRRSNSAGTMAQISDGQMLAYFAIASSFYFADSITPRPNPANSTPTVVITWDGGSGLTAVSSEAQGGASTAQFAFSNAYIDKGDTDATFKIGTVTIVWKSSGMAGLAISLPANLSIQFLALQAATQPQTLEVDFRKVEASSRLVDFPKNFMGQTWEAQTINLGQGLGQQVAMLAGETHSSDLVVPNITQPIKRPTTTQPIERPVEKPIIPVDRTLMLRNVPVEVPIDRPIEIDQPTLPIENPLVPIEVNPDQPVEIPIDRPIEIDQPTLPIDKPVVPIEVNPDRPVEIPVDRPTEIDLTDKGGQAPVVITKGVIEISGFTGVGRGTSPSIDRLAEVDTLRFVGPGMIAKYLQLEQNGQDVILSFEGNNLVKVLLKNVALDELDNLDRLTGASATIGNIIFDGDLITKDSFDVYNSDWYRNTLLNTNTTTFLNDLDNFVYGFDNSNDVINGQGGNDILFGEGGNDLLRGGAGNDILNGGLGQNQLVGGSGCDTFVIVPNGSSDVMDFTFGEDKIQLAQGSTYGQLTLTNFTEGNRGGTQIRQNNQLVMRVFGVTSTQLTTNHFAPWQDHRLT
jgi:hypothetical protein